MPLISERVTNRLIAIATGSAIVLLVAAFTHLTAVLILPAVASKDAFTLLSAYATTNRVTLLPPSRPTQSAIAFSDPATVQGVCSFDLSKTPVRIRTPVEDGHLLTLSFRTPQGKIFYSMTDRAALHGLIDIRLVTTSQLKAIEDQDDDDAGLPSELRLESPVARGLMVATALVARPSGAEAAQNRIKAITCGPEPLPPPQG